MHVIEFFTDFDLTFNITCLQVAAAFMPLSGSQTAFKFGYFIATKSPRTSKQINRIRQIGTSLWPNSPAIAILTGHFTTK
jgi:hypothetical protein